MSGNTPVFALLTDFGLADPYVGQLKAVLFSRAPSVPILDISHDLPPFAVATGAFFLAASRPHYPNGTIFLCVVDPGVGSARDLLCITGERHTLLGPDNGLLSLAYHDMLREGPVAIHALENSPSADAAPSVNTFHGRDILAPVAASLANGAAVATVSARPREAISVPAWSEAKHDTGESVCTVLHVDRFGNCILNLRNSDAHLLYPSLYLHLPRSGKRDVLRQVSHYAELAPGSLGLLPGGQGFYELAVASGSAAERLDISPGDVCRIAGDLWSRG